MKFGLFRDPDVIFPAAGMTAEILYIDPPVFFTDFGMAAGNPFVGESKVDSFLPSDKQTTTGIQFNAPIFMR